jgi:tryptophanyl-tRNA synthetase
MFAYDGELHKVPTFKEKVRDNPDNVNAGLLTYPVLMAVDILIHHAVKVPVGKDQMQHIEMTRNFANRFNHTYGVEYFKEPFGFTYNDKPLSVPSLDGQGKMSKSKGENTLIYLADEPEAIKKKVMRAVSDSGPTEPNQAKPEMIQNLFDLMSLVSKPDTVKFFNEQYNTCTIRYGDMKKQLAEDMVGFLNPVRERIKELSADQAYLNKVLREGGEKARISAGKTISDVKGIIGLK